MIVKYQYFKNTGIKYQRAWLRPVYWAIYNLYNATGVGEKLFVFVRQSTLMPFEGAK